MVSTFSDDSEPSITERYIIFFGRLLELLAGLLEMFERLVKRSSTYARDTFYRAEEIYHLFCQA